MDEMSLNKGIKMYFIKNKLIIPFIFFIVNLSMIFFFVFFSYEAYFQSDAAVSTILAKEIWQTKNLFPSEWWFVNGDIWGLGKPTFFIPFAALNINNYFVYSMVVSIWIILALLCIFYIFYKQIHCNNKEIFFSLGIFLLPIYSALIIIFGEAGYLTAFVWQCIFLILVLASFDNIQEGSNIKKFNTIIFVFFVVVFIRTIANPIRILTDSIIPLIISLTYLLYFHHKDIIQNKLKIIKTLICIFVSFFISSFLYYFIKKNINIIYDASNAVLYPWTSFPRHLAYSIYGTLVYLGAGWESFASPFSIKSLLSITRTFLAPVPLILPFVYFLKTSNKLSFKQKLFSLFSFTGYFLMIFMLSATTLQIGKEYVAATIRYAATFIHFIILSNAMFWRDYSLFSKSCLTAFFTLSLIAAPQYVSPEGWRNIVEKRYSLIRDLQSRNLKYGYAPYWDSHVYTVLSNSNLEIRPISIGKQIFPWRNHSSERWYSDGYGENSKFFLLIPSSSKETLNNAPFWPPYEERFSSGAYEIFVYSKNPVRIMDWKAISLSSLLGIMDEEARIANPSHGQGFLTFGPYVSLPKGEYTFEVMLDASSTGKNDCVVGNIDVYIHKLNRVLQKHEIFSQGAQTIKHKFVVSSDLAYKEFEVRIYYSGVGTLKVYSLKITRL
jgi:hypothetical protein